MSLRWILPLSVTVSAFGLFLVLTLSAYGTRATENPWWQEPLVGSIFATICLSGMALARSPSKCSERFGHANWQKQEDSAQAENSLTIKGHHYDCGKFSAHTILVRGHVLCAACTGLFLGAVGAVLGAIIFFFAGANTEQIGFLGVAFGAVAMVFGFAQFEFRGFGRLMLNILFVLGAFLILVGIDGLLKSLVIDLLMTAMTGFWIFTRILLSQWDHWKICRECTVPCEKR